ncbi:AbiH family protein [Acinetobacter sp. CE-15]|uniref:AbiH family protein n=1 Tax=Acinetobacter sp. CE-15 TaxID=3425693 RepID=UPI003DA59400
MNILIVGNGFDLSHYLPTKYDHFMDVMKAVKEKETGEKIKDLSIYPVEGWMKQLDTIFEKREGAVADPNYTMSFHELFSQTRDSNFIEKTKEFYLTEQIHLSTKDVLKLQYRLELNSWYQYFKNHVEEIKTWIDFEQKIEEVLTTLVNCLVEIEKIKRSSEYFKYFEHEHMDGNRIKEKDFKILNFFSFITPEEYKVKIPIASILDSRPYEIAKRNNLNPKFCHGEKLENGFNPSGFIDFLHQQLEEFISIFDQYLELIVSRLEPYSQLQIDAKEWLYPDRIYSFNYTNTYQRIHGSVDVEYLHGSHGEDQNIVLGVADLDNEPLKKIKAYGFTKYQQKLFKDTDYLFLDNYKLRIIDNKKKLESLDRSFNGDHRTKEMFINELIKNEIFNLNFHIWGHSLDVSDKDYIIDLFSLNDEVDRKVRVIVYYFNKTAKFDLLNNLLAILGKEKVEHWMKNKWLQFKENPKITTEDAITLKDLPKM